MSLDVRLTQQLRRVDIAQRCLRELEQEAQQRPWASQLLQPIGVLLDNIEEDMRFAVSLSVNGKFFGNTIDTCARLADAVTSLMHEIRGAHGRMAPQAFCRPLLGLAKRLLVKQDEEGCAEEPLLLITSRHSPRNYHLRTDLLQSFRVLNEGAFTGVVFPKRLAILQCPGAEFSDVLQHAAIFHELGHAFRDWLPLDLGTVDEAVQQAPGPYVYGDIAGELHADAFAVRAAGPAPALAVAFKAPEGGPNEGYPSRTDRIAVALHSLAPFADQDEFIGWATAQVQEQQGGAITTYTTAVEAAVQLVATALCYEPLQPYAGTHPWARVEALAKRICAYVPPDSLSGRLPVCPNASAGHASGEWSRQAIADLPSAEDISNAGWYVRLDEGTWERFCTGMGKSPDADDDQFEAERRLNNLLLKAMETVQLLETVARQWGGDRDTDRTPDLPEDDGGPE